MKKLHNKIFQRVYFSNKPNDSRDIRYGPMVCRAGSSDSALRALAQGPAHLEPPTKRKKKEEGKIR